MKSLRQHSSQPLQPEPHWHAGVSCFDTLTFETGNIARPPRLPEGAAPVETQTPCLVDLNSLDEVEAFLASVNRLFQSLAGRLDRILSHPLVRAQLEIDSLLADLAALPYRTLGSPGVRKLFDGSSTIQSTFRSWRGVKAAEIFRLSGEACQPGYPITVHVTERAAPAEIILLRSAFSMAGADLRLSLPFSARIRVRGQAGVAEFDLPAGSSVEHMAKLVNAWNGKTAVTASTLNDSLILRSDAVGSDGFVEFWHIDAELPHDLNIHVTANQAHGQDLQASVNGVPAYGQGNALVSVDPLVDVELQLGEFASRQIELAATDGGISCHVNGELHRWGLPSLSLVQLGCAAGRLFEAGTGQTKSMLADSTAATAICQGTAERLRHACQRLALYASAWTTARLSGQDTLLVESREETVVELTELATAPLASLPSQSSDAIHGKFIRPHFENLGHPSEPILVRMGPSVLAGASRKGT